MKRLVTVAALAAVCSAASAQTSSVTIFGVVDAAVRFVKNDDVDRTLLSSGGLSSSRLGFRGVEDLGGGLSAGFWLEHRFNVDDGNLSSSRFWHGRSTLSLTGGFGEVRLGRDYTPTYLGYTSFDPFGDTGVGASSKFDSNLGSVRDTASRADNMLTYLTPKGLGGFYARLAAAAGEATDGKKYYGGQLGYAAGPFDVSVAYGDTEVAPVGGENNFTTFAIGGSYDLGMLKLLAYYRHAEFADQELAAYAIGATMPLGNGVLRAGYTRADAKGTNATGADVDANDADQFAIGYVYNLSKRTALFTTAAFVKNDGNATFAVTQAPATIPGGKSTGFDFGLRHTF